MSGNLIRLFGALTTRPAVQPGGRQTSVWIAPPAQDAESQTLIHRALELDLLVGTGLATAIGPCPIGQPADRQEYLLRLRFLLPFWRAPQVTAFLISTQPASSNPAICGLAVRAVSADGFTLALNPQPGTARMDVEFGWVASGEVVPARGGDGFPVLQTVSLDLPQEDLSHDD